MPEPYWPKRKSYRLTDAAKHNRYAQLRCRYCKAERYYLLDELRVAFGNVECDDVTYLNNWRCTPCRRLNLIDLKLGDPPAGEAQKAKIRRIDRIVYVRKVIWKDE